MNTTQSPPWWRRWNGEHASDELPEPAPAGRATAQDRSDTSHDLWAALGRLPRRQRAVVVLRSFEDLTEAEVARDPKPTVTASATATADPTFRPEASGLPLLASMVGDPGGDEIQRSTVLPADVRFAVAPRRSRWAVGPACRG